MVATLDLQVEVVGCPTVCRHCWARASLTRPCLSTTWPGCWSRPTGSATTGSALAPTRCMKWPPTLRRRSCCGCSPTMSARPSSLGGSGAGRRLATAVGGAGTTPGRPGAAAGLPSGLGAAHRCGRPVPPAARQPAQRRRPSGARPRPGAGRAVYRRGLVRAGPATSRRRAGCPVWRPDRPGCALHRNTAPMPFRRFWWPVCRGKHPTVGSCQAPDGALCRRAMIGPCAGRRCRRRPGGHHRGWCRKVFAAAGL
jgi:hypothetical protein